MTDAEREASARRAAELIRRIPEPGRLDMYGGNPTSPALTRWEDDLLQLAQDLYLSSVPTAELVTFPHGTATYLFDSSGDPHEERTVLAVGRPAAPAQPRDATYQRGYPLPERVANRPVDRGHFMPYTSGGLFGPNLFVQDRALNRGWSQEGKRYRALESGAIGEAPDSLLFVLPHYVDDTAVPGFLNLGMIGAAGLTVDTFRNRYDDPMTLSLETHLAGATDSQIGALGEETARNVVEDVLAGTTVAMGDAGMPRVAARQDLDLVAIVDGTLTVFEVKSRYLARQAGRLTRAGNLLRPQMRRPTGTGSARQGGQPYVADRLAGLIDTGPGIFEGIDVRVIVVDFKVMLAQQFDVNDAGTRLTPRDAPMDCRRPAERALAVILEHRGYL